MTKNYKEVGVLFIKRKIDIRISNFNLFLIGDSRQSVLQHMKLEILNRRLRRFAFTK